MSLSIVEHAGLSDVGRQRQGNEDSYFISAPLFVVADGMGGARAGEVASRIAVEAFEGASDSAESPEAMLAKIARRANRRIHELAQEDESRAGMGTTLSAVMVDGNEIAVGHVGDSRVYRLRDGRLDRLTTDHSLVEELVRQGRLTPEQAEVDPRSSIITRALGPEPEVDVDTFTCAARDGDVYLICSDGLTGMLPERELADVLRSATSLDAGARELVRRANQHGGRDNITVVLFRLGAEPPAADDPDTLSGAVTETAVDAQRVRAAVAAAESDTLAGAPASAPQAARSSRGEAATVIPASAPRTTAAHPRPGHSARADDAAERRRRRALAAVALVMLIAALAVALVLTGGRL